MKKIAKTFPALIAFILLFSLFIFMGCDEIYQTAINNQDEEPAEYTDMAGYIIINEGRVYFREVTLLVPSEGPIGDHFSEIGYSGENIIFVSEEDALSGGIDFFGGIPDWMPSLKPSVVSFELREDAVFTFYDLDLRFISEEDARNYPDVRRYSTTILDEFLSYRPSIASLFSLDNPGHLMTPEERLMNLDHGTVMVIIRVQDNQVIGITEEFWFTQ